MTCALKILWRSEVTMSKRDESQDKKVSLNNSGLSSEDIEKLIKADRSDDKIESRKATARTSKKVWRVLLVSLIFFGVLASIVMLNPATSPFFGDKENAVPKTAAQEPAENVKGADEPWWISDPNAALPFRLADWQRAWGEVDATAFSKKQSDYFRGMVDGTALQAKTDVTLLQGDTWTTNPKDAVDPKTGLPNSDYAYVTGDLFINESGDALHRMLNPLYGGWGAYQFSEAKASKSFNVEPFRGIFSDHFLNKFSNKKNLSNFPVYADWKGNNYGRNDLIPVAPARWLGKVNSADVVISYSKETLNYQFDATYEVEFSARTLDQKIVKKHGTLKVKYITETNLAPHNPKAHRILVDDAKLTIK